MQFIVEAAKRRDYPTVKDEFLLGLVTEKSSDEGEVDEFGANNDAPVANCFAKIMPMDKMEST